MHLNKPFLFLIWIVLLTISCENSEVKTEKTIQKTSEEIILKNDSYSSKLIFDENIGWGYQIFKGAKLLINQNHIPAVQGVKGFSSKEKAQKTIDYIMPLLESGVFPPTITPEILDSLNVL